MSGLSKDPVRVAKTFKLFIGGEFPRTESGRSFAVNFAGSDRVYANLCFASRKDLRNAVSVAKEAQAGWQGRSAYNRGQILYRLGEMLEGKFDECVQVLIDTLGRDRAMAKEDVRGAIDACIYYAGFADKFQQLSGSVNPVSGPHHNFTSPEPVGVVGILPADSFYFSYLVAEICAVITSGNTTVCLLAEEGAAMVAPLAEALATSDLPKGVVNLLTSSRSELQGQFGSHMEIQALALGSKDLNAAKELKKLGVTNLKRIAPPRSRSLGLDRILDFVEFKTVWHPIGS